MKFDFRQFFFNLMENFLKLEFDDFLYFYRSKNVEIDLRPPPLELELLSELEILQTRKMGKFGNLIMKNNEISKNNEMLSKESIKAVQPVKIRFNNIEMRADNLRRHCEFRITCVLNDIPRIPLRHNYDLQKPKPNFSHLIVYNPIMNFEYLQYGNGIPRGGPFHMISLAEASVSRTPFWTDLYPISLNPISPIAVKEIDYKDTHTIILLPKKNILERLREVAFEPVGMIKCESMNEPRHNHFKKKCVINYDILLDDVLIDILQSRDWIIYERIEKFRGAQVIQVSKDRVIALIQLETIQSKLNIVEQFKNLTIILEVKNQKYSKMGYHLV